MASIPTHIQDEVAKQLNAVLPTLQAPIMSWYEGGQKGPMPTINVAVPASDADAPPVENPAANAPAMEPGKKGRKRPPKRSYYASIQKPVSDVVPTIKWR